MTDHWEVIIESLDQPTIQLAKTVHASWKDALARWWLLDKMEDKAQIKTKQAVARAWLVRADGTALEVSYLRTVSDDARDGS